MKDLSANHTLTAQDQAAYRLTSLGEDLTASLNPLRNWAQRWAERVASRDVLAQRGGSFCACSASSAD